MFVKILRGEQYSVYECNKVETGIKGSEDPDEDILLITIDGPHQCLDFEVDRKTKTRTGVFLMNDEGRTIDTIFMNYR